MAIDKARMMKIASTAGWVAVVLSVLLLLFSGVIRLVSLTQDPALADAFDVRYIQHPWATLLHIVPGALFLSLGPLQFVARIRQRRIGVHRRLGRILLISGAISGVLSLIVNFLFPAAGGVSTQAATAFFGVIFLFSLAKAFRHILKKEVPQHREWMIRAFSLAMAVATERVLLVLLIASTGLSLEEVFGASFWLAFSLNLLVAEVWINYTRRNPRQAQ